MMTQTVQIYSHIADNGRISAYQDENLVRIPQEYSWMPKRETRVRIDDQWVKILKHWDGEIIVDIELDKSSPMLSDDDFSLLGIKSIEAFDIGKFFDGFAGDAFAKQIIKSYPVVIKFQGSGMLFKDGKEVI